MKKLIIILICLFAFNIGQSQTTEIKVTISDDPVSGLDRVVYWDSNCENLKAGYYEIQFGVSYQKNNVEVFSKGFVYKTDDANNETSRRNIMNNDGTWHTCLNSTDARWNAATPEYLFWFNLVNKTQKPYIDETFKTSIISNLDEAGFFNQ